MKYIKSSHQSQSTCFLTKHQAVKAYWGSGGTAPCILNLGTRYR